MNTSLLPASLVDVEPFGPEALVDPIPANSIPTQITNHLVKGTATLGAAVFVERGAGFLANILAARLGGASVFGAYALGISTANNISTYAAGGIGATATRFSGKYGHNSGDYATFARVLGVVSLVSALLAATALWFGASPIALLLHQTGLTHLLRWASISAAGMILLECARGFFVGQHRLAALILLSLLVGAGMVSLLPAIAATHRPSGMIVAQGAVMLTAVGTCLVLAGPLDLRAPRGGPNPLVRFGVMLREVWAFGFVQLSGLLSANLAGWWLTALVARSDTTLVQMGFFAIASQLRNLTGIIPGLLTESSYAAMASESHDAGMPDRVMALCAFVATSASFLLASTGIVIVPWGLRLLYGQRYGTAGVTAAVAMAVAVIQMGNSPASARMSIVSIRWVAIGNTAWAIFVASIGTLFLFRGGSAAGAMAVFFAGHVLLAALVLIVLHRHNHLPKGMVPLFFISTFGIFALCLIAVIRQQYPAKALSLSLLMLAIAVGSTLALRALAKRHNWLPNLASIRNRVEVFPSFLRAQLRLRKERRLHAR